MCIFLFSLSILFIRYSWKISLYFFPFSKDINHSIICIRWIEKYHYIRKKLFREGKQFHFVAWANELGAPGGALDLLLYTAFPWVKGIYLYFNICLICRFIVRKNSRKKYITKIGQKTGMFRASKQVQNMAIRTAFVAAYQNLNSGNLRINGRNSSLDFVGRDGPSSV